MNRLLILKLCAFGMNIRHHVFISSRSGVPCNVENRPVQFGSEAKFGFPFLETRVRSIANANANDNVRCFFIELKDSIRISSSRL